MTVAFDGFLVCSSRSVPFLCSAVKRATPERNWPEYDSLGYGVDHRLVPADVARPDLEGRVVDVMTGEPAVLVDRLALHLAAPFKPQ